MSIQDKVLMRKIKKREKQKLKLVQQKENQLMQSLNEDMEVNQGPPLVPSISGKRQPNEHIGPGRSKYDFYYKT